MEFLKNHYEKVLLSAVLLGLAVVVALLPSKARSTNPDTFPSPQPLALKPLDLSTNLGALQSLGNLNTHIVTASHNIFNPLVWRRRADGVLLKIDESTVGPGAVKVDRITPLHFVLTFEGLSGPGYIVGVTQETNKNPNLRRKITRFATLNDKKDFGTIVAIVGPEDDPAGLLIQMPETTNQVAVTKTQPFKIIQGYAADLRYEPENLVRRDVRAGDNLVLEKETNNIVEINSNVVVLSESSGKRTKLICNAAP